MLFRESVLWCIEAVTKSITTSCKGFVSIIRQYKKMLLVKLLVSKDKTKHALRNMSSSLENIICRIFLS